MQVTMTKQKDGSEWTWDGAKREVLPGHEVFELLKAELKAFSSQAVGGSHNVLLVLQDAVELDVPVATINQANY